MGTQKGGKFCPSFGFSVKLLVEVYLSVSGAACSFVFSWLVNEGTGQKMKNRKCGQGLDQLVKVRKHF